MKLFNVLMNLIIATFIGLFEIGLLGYLVALYQNDLRMAIPFGLALTINNRSIILWLMRKEVVWAIFAGIVLGLIVAFGAFRIKSNISLNQTEPPKINTATLSPTQVAPKEFKIVLDKPVDHEVVTQNTITVTGITQPSTWILVSAESSDSLSKSDSSGAFSQQIVLSPGVNQIKIFAIDNSGNQKTTGVTVVYSSGFQEKSLLPGETGASDSSNIKQKVTNDINNLLNKPKAYIGTVTDITDATLEIKTSQGEIQQISLSNTQNVLNVVGTNNKQVKVSDIAIGDYITAMGYVESNSVLSAQRILITDALSDPKTTVNEAKVLSVTKKNLTVSTLSDQASTTIEPAKNTDIERFKDDKVITAKLSDINVDDTVIYVNTNDDKGSSFLRSVFIVSQS